MLIIDRFEGEMAVIEYGDKTFNLPRNLLSEEVREGDVLRVKIEVDKEETKRRKEVIKNLEEDVFE